MEHFNAQVSQLYGVNVGEYGEAGVSSMMALMTAHQLQGDGESIMTRRVPSQSLFNVQAADSLVSAVSMFQPNKFQRQSQAVMEQHLTDKPISSVPLVKIEGSCHNLSHRLGFHREHAVNCFAESSSMQLGNQAAASLASQALEADSPHFSSDCRTSISTAAEENEVGAIKAKIVAHPQYRCLLEAFINCQKVGAPPEVVARLEAVSREHQNRTNMSIGMDPELDRFMEAYGEMLSTYREELTKPFQEAMSFFKQVETQLNCMTDATISLSPSGEMDEKTEGGGFSEEEDCSTGEMEYEDVVHHQSEDRELKDRLLRKYSGYLSSLKQEFMKKKKKGKLPKDARQKLLDWWNLHYKWPYPSEIEKVALAECTGLDQKQINNWFINQRKRHWKPCEDTQLVLMDTHSPHTAAFFVERHLMTEGSAFHLDC